MWQSVDDDTTEWNPPTAIGQDPRRLLPSMGIDNATRGATADPGSCRTTLTAAFTTDRHPDWDRLVLRLLDERIYGEHFAASKHMIERGQSMTGPSEPDQPAIELLSVQF